MILRAITANYYLWVTVVWLMYPLLIVVVVVGNVCSGIWGGLVDAWEDIRCEITGPAYTRRQYDRVKRRHRRQ